MTEESNLEKLSLGKIVNQIMINQEAIRCLIGSGGGDSRFAQNTPMRHEYEKKQQLLYRELDKREEQYRKR